MKRERHNYDEKEEDRLTDLPESVLLHLLSFLTAKEAVQTCILSTRWINLWKHLPIFKISSSYFNTMDGFTEFIAQFLSLRDDSTALDYLLFNSKGMVEPQILERILQYAVSHNVQQMLIVLNYNIEHFPSCIFSCLTLTSLKLMVSHHNGTLFPNSLNLPALSTLSLLGFVFCSDDNDDRAEPFSTLKKLNSLTIWLCEVDDAQNLCISNATLSNLKIQTNQRWSYRKIELRTPNLSKFAYAGTALEKLCGSHLCSIEHIMIDAYMCSDNAQPPSNLLSWLRALTDVKSLTVTSTTLQVLSLYPNLLKVKLDCLRNLKLLRVLMEGISSGTSNTLVDGIFLNLSVKCQEEVAKFREAIFKKGFPATLKEMVGFLLQNSQSAKIQIISSYLGRKM